MESNKDLFAPPTQKELESEEIFAPPTQAEIVETEEQENLPEEKGILEALARGGAQGLSLGFADEITGALEAGYETVFGKDKLEDLMENYAKYRDESRKEYEQAEKDQKAAYLTGEFGSGIGAALLTGGAAAPALARSAGVQALSLVQLKLQQSQ